MPNLSSLVIKSNPLRYPPNAVDMSRGELLDYLRTHPNRAATQLPTDLAGALDAAVASDVTLDAGGRVFHLHQAMAWCRAIEAKQAATEAAIAAAAVAATAAPVTTAAAATSAALTAVPPAAALAAHAEQSTKSSVAPDVGALFSEHGAALVVKWNVDESLAARLVLYLYTNQIKEAVDAELLQLIDACALTRPPAFVVADSTSALARSLGILLSSARFRQARCVCSSVRACDSTSAADRTQ